MTVFIKFGLEPHLSDKAAYAYNAVMNFFHAAGTDLLITDFISPKPSVDIPCPEAIGFTFRHEALTVEDVSKIVGVNYRVSKKFFHITVERING